MLTVTLERDAWVGSLDGSPSLQVVIDLENGPTSRPPHGGLLSVALEGKSFLLAIRSAAGLGLDPWYARIEAPTDRVREIEALLTIVPAIRVTQFGADGSWTAKYARGGMALQNPRRFEPHLRLLAVRLGLVLNRLVAKVPWMHRE